MSKHKPHIPLTTLRPEQLESSPWLFSFFSVCRWMDARHPKHPPLGTASLPSDESLRLGQSPSTVFATREIASAMRKDGRLHLLLLGLGLWGPHGPMPLHFTEEAHERVHLLRDSTLVDFLNIFHHRWLSHFYRAWSMAQSTAGLDRPDKETFSTYVASLAGHSPAAAKQDTARPQIHARLGATAHLSRHSRNPMGLVATLEHYFGLTVRLEEYRFHWLQLEAESHCRLGLPRHCCRLGQDSVLGGHVPDRQCSFALHLGPLTLEQYHAFLPGQPHVRTLRQWVREFVGVELHWTLHLTVRPEAVPPCTLAHGSAQDNTAGRHLGRDTWLGRSPKAISVAGMTFAPEQWSGMQPR